MGGFCVSRNWGIDFLPGIVQTAHMDKKVLIPEDVHRAAKIAAAKAGIPLQVFVSQAVANATRPYLVEELAAVK